ncbi:hypothetical protein BCR33DRAFT_782854 [Rhizoclosmatium globosum]|uniref:Uncharacterized protein n=1 Tax=Rhizoclosmatium globosum TaxID=329046 RepID=A0A1Y2CL84_9FUNG|nr:hypothetical protein BCR33DRAFT_782854 [Rhizoclosmatium globosum]|eukprot:ORY47778.1 hypothetical protein BCR33DRAFT_782854 [Rhizoclosmatium globosum]
MSAPISSVAPVVAIATQGALANTLASLPTVVPSVTAPSANVTNASAESGSISASAAATALSSIPAVTGITKTYVPLAATSALPSPVAKSDAAGNTAASGNSANKANGAAGPILSVFGLFGAFLLL